MTYWYYAGLSGGAIFFVYQLWLIRSARPRRLLSRLPQQQLFRHGGFIGLVLAYLFAWRLTRSSTLRGFG